MSILYNFPTSKDINIKKKKKKKKLIQKGIAWYIQVHGFIFARLNNVNKVPAGNNPGRRETPGAVPPHLPLPPFLLPPDLARHKVHQPDKSHPESFRAAA